MDGERFDDLVKRFCTTPITRLSALRGLAGGAVAALAGGLLVTADLEAKGKTKGKAKGSHKRSTRRSHTRQRPQQVTAQAGNCRQENQTCEGSNPNCCADLVCSAATNPTRCVPCGDATQECCANFQWSGRRVRCCSKRRHRHSLQ